MQSYLNTFFQTDTLSVAQKLLGCFLQTSSKEGLTSGKIIETEAYLFDDPASKTFKGKNKRNSPLFGPPGYTYVYLTYGKILYLNITSGEEGKGEGVLIRALEPTQGVELMKRRRRKEQIKDLCSGPGKLTQALGLTLEDSNIKIGKGRVRITLNENSLEINKTKRIGISKAKDELLRFYIKGNKFISKP